MKITVSNESTWNIRSKNLFLIKKILEQMTIYEESGETGTYYKSNKRKLQHASSVIEDVVMYRLRNKDVRVVITLEPTFHDGDKRMTFDLCVIHKDMRCFEAKLLVSFTPDHLDLDSEAIIYNDTEWEWCEHENRREDLEKLLDDINEAIDEAISTRRIFKE